MANHTAFRSFLYLSSILISLQGLHGASFTFTNRCSYTVWPATLSGARSPALSQTGFELATGATVTLDAPPKWSGRMWARSRCTNAGGRFSCATGDCGTGQVACNNQGGAPPATLVEFTLNGDGGKDFYDTSLVDGFNLPMSISPQGGQGGCSGSACSANVNAVCPPELQQKGGDGSVVGCKSACVALGQDQYCCRGQYGSPQTCKPTQYSQIFKRSCPQAYSYAYDDASSTFTCIGASYVITFCP